MPWFIDNRQLRTAVWLIVEGISQPIIERLDRIMSLVTVDSDALAAIAPAVTALETEFENFLTANPAIPAGSLDSVNAALTDFKSKLDAATTPVTPPAGGGTVTPPATTTGAGDTGTTTPPATGTTTPPATGATDGTGALVDPATGLPVTQ